MSTADLLMPPDDAAVERAVAAYAKAIRAQYGRRLKGIFLFGSRARGDHARDSDADIAVVLADDGWESWPETKKLTDIAYDIIVETGAGLEAWPVSEDAWHSPERYPDASLLKAMQRDAKPVEAAA